jgi:hypothetical protein
MLFLMRCVVLILGLLLPLYGEIADRWAPIRFLIGEWTGEGGGGPGQGSGSFSFLTDQQNTILVRKNRADYPATKDRPAATHTDLMIVYQEESKLRAIYFDTEDHVIHYDVLPAADGSSVQFLSPNFRLTYRKTGGDTLGIKFEIAPPGKAGAFATYIEASARKASR